MKRSVQHALIALLSFALVACGGGGSALTLPGISPYTLTLVAAPSATTADGAPVTLTATLRDTNNVAVTGATLQFQSTVGRLGTASAQTDGAGSASVVLFAGTGGIASGQASVSFLDPDHNVAHTVLAVATQGNESSGTGGTPGTPGTPVPTMVVTMLSSAGLPSDAANPVTDTAPGTLRAVVRDATGALVPNALVTFAIDSIASISQSTALTDSNGQAEVVVIANAAGAGTARASATVAGTAISGSAVFATSVAGGGGTGTGTAPSVSLEVRTSGGLIADSANPLTNMSPGQLIATVFKDGAAQAGVLVTFSATTGATVSPTTALTDGAGQAKVAITATATGAGTATAVANVGGVVVTRTAVYATSVGAAASDTPVMTLAVLDADGVAVSSVSPITNTAPGTLRARITINSVAVADTPVHFELGTGSGASLSTTDALTDGNGVAQVPVEAVATGAGTLLATATVSGVALEAEQPYATALETAAPLVLDLGYMAPGGFLADALGINVLGAIAPGSDVVVTADVIDKTTGVAYPNSVTVAFQSTCVSQGKATIDASASTVDGRATATYRPSSCTGQDTVTATVTTATQTLTASVNVSIVAEELGSLAFVSATPRTLALRGTGGAGRLESSEVKFRVLGAQGNPLSAKPVCFLLSTDVGGITLGLDQNGEARATSNGLGEAIAVVRAGTVPTPVRVTAYVDNNGTCNDAKPDPLIQTVSDVLTVSTGLPHQRSFSLAVNPTDEWPAYSYDGVTWSAAVYMADHFSNPVPDGTAVNFWTELGAIQPSCTTTGGTCTVQWRSQAPRDSYDVRNRDAKPNPTRFRDRRGRSTIVAYAVGEESFVDFNGNGLFDGDNPNEVNSVVDLEEVIKDTDYVSYMARYLEALVLGEEFVDFNGNGVHDLGNGIFDGVLCGSGAGCTGDATVHVRAYNEIVMSTNSARVYIVQPDVDLTSLDFTVDGYFTGIVNPPNPALYELDPTGQTVRKVYCLRGGNRFVVMATDSNGNQLAAGTKVTVKPNSSAGTVDGTSTYDLARVVGEADWFAAMFSLRVPSTAPTGVGTVAVEVEHPDGVKQTFFFDADWVTP